MLSQHPSRSRIRFLTRCSIRTHVSFIGQPISTAGRPTSQHVTYFVIQHTTHALLWKLKDWLFSLILKYPSFSYLLPSLIVCYSFYQRVSSFTVCLRHLATSIFILFLSLHFASYCFSFFCSLLFLISLWISSLCMALITSTLVSDAEDMYD